MISNNPLISIFVPIYNGEKYLEKTLNSIVSQTYTNIEVLLVNDSSTDNSLQICNVFVEKDNRFKIFTKSRGGNTSTSWNFILPKIKGEFVFYSSQDDLFSHDLIERLVLKQRETQVDCVLPIMEYFYEDQIQKRIIKGLRGNLNCIIDGKIAFLASLDWSIHGFGLIKLSLYQDEVFPEDTFNSDEFMIRKIFLKCNSVSFCNSKFFYRQDNSLAITKIDSKDRFFELNTQLRIIELLELNFFDKKLIKFKKYILFRDFLKKKIKVNNYKFATQKDKNDVEKFLIEFRYRLINLFSNDNFDINFFNISLKCFISRIIVNNSFFLKVTLKLK
ncbi:glycosyltransferase family 2 protein [Flavobacterium sp. H122]|uniref:glycosyltransferase family 2 protein n=1 Tax=Flavobacterium sp. H122 TaxID=2529860 RepID=UPI0010AA64BD|nr:glycosyltransferase family 2 protein [Flavobacterium sp. H122]